MNDQELKEAANLPLYFSSLRLANIRCFGDQQTIDFLQTSGRHAGWTILIGDNGVGKTTILQILAEMQPDLGKQHSSKIRDMLLLQTIGFSSPLRFNITKVAQGKPAEIELFLSQGELENRLYLTATEKAAGFFEAECSPHGSTTQNLLCYVYGANRKTGQISFVESSEKLNTPIPFADDAELINAEEWLLLTDYAVRRQVSGSVERQKKINSAIVSLLPDVTQIRIQDRAETARAEFETPFGWVLFDDLSLGYRSAMTWMIDLSARLFARYPDSENPLHEPAIVLIDEIDLHLHPKWQRQLLTTLSATFPNTQFIATAHSPLIVQAAQDANIVLLRKEGDHVVIDNDTEHIRNWRVDQILTSELFDLPSSRSASLDPLQAERTELLSKSKLTAKDRARLAEVERQIGNLPEGETPLDIEAADIIRRAAAILKPKIANGSD